MKRLYSLDDFARLAKDDPDAVSESGVTMTAVGEPTFGEGRTVDYVFSTPQVGRDMHTVAANAWRLDNYRQNPVFLWAHDDEELPIGRVIAIGDDRAILRGTVEYADAELNPFADLVYRLVRAKYLNAVSTSWLPLEWNFSRDKARPGGIDFSKVDLLEISQVPVPALPTALADARRSLGLDTTPIYTWAERLLDKGGMTLVPRTELETLRRAAKMPKAKTVQTDPTPPAAVVDPPAAPPADTAAAELAAARAALAAKHKRALARAPGLPRFTRGFYELAQLAGLMDALGYCHWSAEYEAALEGDGSPVPGMIGEALKAAGVALVAMAEEEVSEALAQLEASEGEITRSVPPDELAFVAEGKTARARAWRAAIAIGRAGKAISAATAKTLGDADDHCSRALKHHKTLEEHQGAVSDHIDSAKAAHARTTSTLAELGEHVRAAANAESDDDKDSHLAAAQKSHKKATEANDEVGDAHADAADRCEDAGDSHRAGERCVKSAQRCVRSVTQEGAEDTEAADDDKDVKEKDAVESRARRARALKLRGLPADPSV
jgi:HK97 family phage prohead protease